MGPRAGAGQASAGRTDHNPASQGDRQAVLRKIFEPSHRVDAEFAMHGIVTTEGKVLSGIVTASSQNNQSVLVNPEAPLATVVPHDQIDEMV